MHDRPTTASLLRVGVRALFATLAALALVAAQPGGALAHEVAPAADGHAAALLPGSADRPVLSRGGGTASPAADDKSKNKSKAKTKAATNKASKNVSNTGTRSASKNVSTAGTNTVGTQSQDMAERQRAAAGVQKPATKPTTAASVTENTNSVSKNVSTAGTNTVGTQTQNPEERAAAAQAQQNAVAGFQQAPPAQQAPAKEAAPATLGLQALPSTSTAALPAGTIALLSMGGAIYAIRKLRKK